MNLNLCILVVVAALAALGQLLLKQTAQAPRPATWWARMGDPRLPAAVCCFAACPPLVVWALRSVDFSVYYASTALNYVFVAGLSRAFLGEALDWRKITSCVLIVAGLIVFSLG